MWITDMQEKVYQVYDEQHQVLTIYFNAYPESKNQFSVDQWNQK